MADVTSKQHRSELFQLTTAKDSSAALAASRVHRLVLTRTGHSLVNPCDPLLPHYRRLKYPIHCLTILVSSYLRYLLGCSASASQAWYALLISGHIDIGRRLLRKLEIFGTE